jgi:toxin ParE1/3/4
VRRRVAFSARALEDLRNIGLWIGEHASDRIADRYLRRLRSYCESFDIFPERGTRRNDLRPGVRTIGFERRVTVAFAVFEKEVLILRLFYSGRDIERAFREEDFD